MTEKELINALEYCANNGNNCKYCPLYNKSKCFLLITKESLNHINRLKTENENYSHNIKQLTTENMQLHKEIERLETAFGNSQKTSKYWHDKCGELAEEVQTTKSEAEQKLKEMRGE
jgi:uncharacterized coiled-coil DUF342 family protein